MIKLALVKYTYDLKMIKSVKGFDKPIVFYKYDSKDLRRFFLTFSIVEFSKGTITHMVSNTPENREIMKNYDESVYRLHYAPHCTIEIREDIDFLVFFQEESYFMYINRRDEYLIIYTMEDILTNCNVRFKTISSTFFKDDADNGYFYMAALSYEEMLYVFRVSNDLSEIEQIDVFPGKSNPPHTVRKFKDCMLYSHEFKEAKYYLKKTNTVISDKEMGSVFVKLQMRIDRQYPELNKYEKKKILSMQIDDKYNVKCIPSKIIFENLNTKEKITYETSGSNSAHFEIDPTKNMIYVSSHNFFEGDGYVFMFQPAVLDKFEYIGDSLVWRGCFTYEKGYRFTSHRIFYLDGKAYLCTFSKPNRLLIINPDTMSLLFYIDIGKDELSNTKNLAAYLNARHEDPAAGSEFIGLEVAEDGESIFFLDDNYLFILNVRDRTLSHKIEYSINGLYDANDYRLIAPHITHLQ